MLVTSPSARRDCGQGTAEIYDGAHLGPAQDTMAAECASMRALSRSGRTARELDQTKTVGVRDNIIPVPKPCRARGRPGEPVPPVDGNPSSNQSNMLLRRLQRGGQQVRKIFAWVEGSRISTLLLWEVSPVIKKILDPEAGTAFESGDQVETCK